MARLLLRLLAAFHVRSLSTVAVASTPQTTDSASGLMRRASLGISEAGVVQARRHLPAAGKSTSPVEMYFRRDASWSLCSPNCKCQSRRRMVIRYKPRIDTEFGARPECSGQTSWYYAQHTLGYSSTPEGAFNMGLTGDKVRNVSICGNEGGAQTICPVAPDACHFDDATGGNPNDAQTGQYCCDKSLGYCSYKCQDQESFFCPSHDPKNRDPPDGYPGGFDPCKGWPKACFKAQYTDGATPETDGEDGT